MHQRQDHALRAFIDALIAQVANKSISVTTAAEEMQRKGVRLGIIGRVLSPFYSREQPRR